LLALQSAIQFERTARTRFAEMCILFRQQLTVARVLAARASSSSCHMLYHYGFFLALLLFFLLSQSTSLSGRDELLALRLCLSRATPRR
jgi:hypothetical protein